MSADVTLAWDEFTQAAFCGLQRQTMALANDRVSRDGRQFRTWLEQLADNIVGACGERAYCKLLGRYWTGSLTSFHTAPDVGTRTEIRTARRTDGDLVVRAADPIDRAYVLVVGQPPTLCVVGYIEGIDARRDEWLRDPGNHGAAYFVPQSALRPINREATA